MKILTAALLSTAFAWTIHKSQADVRLPALLSDGLVLQRDRPVNIWGWADAGELVTVEFSGQKRTAIPGEGGSWTVQLDAMPANATPADIIVSGEDSIRIKNVLVGEVWLCSGQSNMELSVGVAKDAKTEIAAAKHPQIRHFDAANATATSPGQDCSGSWLLASPETVSRFTAVGYFFGRELHRELAVPVGLINASWGGTPVEAWTSGAALAAEPAAAPILQTWQKAIADYDPEKAKAKHKTDLALFQKWVAEARAAGGRPPTGTPRLLPSPALSRHAPSNLYNAMIAPVLPYGIRGVIWYQGEANRNRAFQYRSLFPAMISDWRKQFGQGEFPFYFVQLANFRSASSEPNIPDPWAELQEAQTLTLPKSKNTGMATINDIGDAEDVHPRNKQEVGRRLALWALAGTYGRNDLVHSGPIYREMAIEGERIRIEFDHTGSGLKSRDGGTLKRFEIAGEDRNFVWANAEIDGASVIVFSPEISKPIAVRYAWAANPAGANLVNQEGLPAPLFRTDDWPGVTKNNSAPIIRY